MNAMGIVILSELSQLTRKVLCSANTRFRSTSTGNAAMGRLWHHRSVIVLLRVVLRLLADLAGLIALSVRPRRAIEAENLVLRRQLALFKERRMKPRRIDAATRASLALLSRWSVGTPPVESTYGQRESAPGRGTHRQ